MSASPIARSSFSTNAQSIPSKKVMISDPNQMPDVYSSTPNGTLYSTTPGGTRIIYERAFLMNLKNSPLSRTPPSNVPSTLIRGCKNVPMSKLNGNRYTTTHSVSRSPPTHKGNEEHQFDMEL
jgi:translation initiation factor 4E binding protein 2